MAKKRNARHFDAPQLHGDHPRPVTRRQFVAQGFMTGAAYTTGAGILSLFANPREAFAQTVSNLSQDMQNLLLNPCQIASNGAGKIRRTSFRRRSSQWPVTTSRGNRYISFHHIRPDGRPS